MPCSRGGDVCTLNFFLHVCVDCSQTSRDRLLVHAIVAWWLAKQRWDTCRGQAWGDCR